MNPALARMWESLLRLACGSRPRISLSQLLRTERTNGEELQLRGDLTGRTARVARGRHRASQQPRPSFADVATAAAEFVRDSWIGFLWITSVALWLWVTYKSALIEMPRAVAVSALITAGLAFGAGHAAGKDR